MINVSGPLQLINSRSSSINWHRVRRQDRVERAGNSGANLPEHGGVRPEAQPRPQSSGGGTCAWFATQISVGESQPTAYVVARRTRKAGSRRKRSDACKTYVYKPPALD